MDNTSWLAEDRVVTQGAGVEGWRTIEVRLSRGRGGVRARPGHFKTAGTR